MTSLCINMIVKNESHVIEKTLSMLLEKLPVTYWVISDTGSTDGTQDLIRNFFKLRGVPGELVEHEWRDFGWNRTKALEACFNKTDYLIIFDADDWIHGDLVLPKLSPPSGPNFDAPVDMYHFKFGPGMTYKRPLLLNNRLQWKFRGVLHEFIAGGRPGGNRESNLEGDYYVESGKTGDRSKDPNKYDKDAAVLEKGFQEELDYGLRDRYAFYCAQSYMDGRRPEKSIEWYKRVLTQQNWGQEKYYSCLMIAGQTKCQDEAIKYYNEAHQYDTERLEHVRRLMEIYHNRGCHLSVNSLYHKFRKSTSVPNPSEKLFMAQWDYNHLIEWYNSISAFYVHDYETGYECCRKIIMGDLISKENLALTIKNLTFYQGEMDKDTDLVALFHRVNNRMNPEDEGHISVWKQLYQRVQMRLTEYSYLPKIPKRGKVQVMLSMTTCQRYSLFEKTINSILSQWMDVDRIGYWFCVDDNSSAKDRKVMQTRYPFFDYYFKGASEKGHIASMNIIWNKLNQLRPTYWIHLEDDFLFFDRMDYITKAIEGLTLMKGQNVKQVLFNRGYGETIDDYRIKSFTVNENVDFCVHDYRPGSETYSYANCHYWPNYSFRPSLLDVNAVLSIGNYDCVDKFFEIEYAKKWTQAGFKSAFFNKLTCIHIGRLTSERHNPETAGKNAYDLNGVDEFNGRIVTQNNSPCIKVVNLERRPDRRQQMVDRFREADVTNYEFYRAVDGASLTLTEEICDLFEGNDFGNRKGVIGCAVTHLNLWRQLVEDTEHDFYLIMEDDATLGPSFKERLNSLNLEMTQRELVFMGYHMFNKERASVQEEYSNNKDPVIQPLNVSRYIGGTFCYSINKKGAQLLISYISKSGIKHGIDYLMKIAHVDTADNWRFETVPQLVFSEWNEGGKDIDTDIQNTGECFDFKEALELKSKFEFVQGMDQTGNDLYFRRASVMQMMKDALKDPEVKCFNTLGFFKSLADSSLFSPSIYFSEKDGTYIKKSAEVITVKPICNWCTSKQLCEKWDKLTKGNGTWNNLKLVYSDKADYYAIINKPLNQEERFIPERTVIFQMEPKCSLPSQTWGTKTWGEWADPDEKRFLAVRTHDKAVNNAVWELDETYQELIDLKPEKTQGNAISSICSSKYFDPGHIKRVDFLRFMEENPDPAIPVHIYGYDNKLNFKSYLGVGDPKIEKIAPYKYYFMCENNAEKNYITEKLWDSILCETLCFYWGCPNVEEVVDPRAYVKLDMDAGFEEVYKVIKQAITENWYEQRLPYIRQEKERVLNWFSFMPTMERIIGGAARSPKPPSVY
jgi:GR25 family glycosyltransferase involved in LPS biosynthesis